MLKRLSTMASMKRISSAFVEEDEEVETGFAPFDLTVHGIQEIVVVSCEMKSGTALFALESKEGQQTWRNTVTGKMLELFSLSLMNIIHPGAANLPFPLIENSENAGEVNLEKTRDDIERWLNSLLSLKFTSGEINQLYCILIEKFALLHETDEYMKRIDSTVRIYGHQLIKTGYVTKLGGNKQGGQGNWKRRYLVLSENLKYYLSEEDFLKQRDPKGIVSLSSYFVTEAEHPNTQFEFTVYTIPFPFTCRADSAIEMQSWIETLRFAQGVL